LKTTEADIFDQLAHLSQLCVQKPCPSHYPKTRTHALALISPVTAASWASTKGEVCGPHHHHLDNIFWCDSRLACPPVQTASHSLFMPVPTNQGLLAPAAAKGYDQGLGVGPSPSLLGQHLQVQQLACCPQRRSSYSTGTIEQHDGSNQG
jgi:hypothetical protein